MKIMLAFKLFKCELHFVADEYFSISLCLALDAQLLF